MGTRGQGGQGDKETRRQFFLPLRVRQSPQTPLPLLSPSPHLPISPSPHLPISPSPHLLIPPSPPLQGVALGFGAGVVR
ncbi:hypothetical protein [Tolypothrix sp. VBCCA 56010]|uniref:hypothetical protein n=1 Tax=Tolypothrix sp. VBCCA 56010 TaxID=3137731 RepID=UPI003D7E1913